MQDICRTFTRSHLLKRLFIRGHAATKQLCRLLRKNWSVYTPFFFTNIVASSFKVQPPNHKYIFRSSYLECYLSIKVVWNIGHRDDCNVTTLHLAFWHQWLFSEIMTRLLRITHRLFSFYWTTPTNRIRRKRASTPGQEDLARDSTGCKH